MGAIDPFVAKNHVKLKSASIEATSNQSSRRPMIRHSQYDCDDMLSLFNESNVHGKHKDDANPSYVTTSSSSAPSSSSQQQKSKKGSTLSPASLKPSVSTSCLLTADDSNTSSSLVCIPTRASLTHQWKKLKTPNKCRECNLLVYFNGRECSFCGFVAHKKCVTVLVIKCSGQKVAGLNKNQILDRTQQLINHSNSNNQTQRNKVKPPMRPIFGQPLSADDDQVVDFMRRFVYEIDTRGLTSKGIYRVSSIKSKVDRLCNYYDQNLSSLVDLSSFHPNIIANALKMYLRQLPEPLLTREHYHEFIEVAKKYSSSTSSSLPHSSSKNLSKHLTNHNQAPIAQTSRFMSTYRHGKPFSLPVLTKTTAPNNNPAYDPLLIVELKEVIELMPPINIKLVAIIMRHLKRVSDMSEENQMSAKNLSIIFGPTLLSLDTNKSLAIVDNIHQARVVELMITWADQIFPQYANYESTAVIELDFSEKEREEYEKLEQTKRQNQKSDSNDLRNLTERHHKEKDCIMIQDESSSEMVLARSNKTRNDLKELRRQFFTTPAPQSEKNTNNSGHGALKAANKKEPRKNRSYNPPGSVPVIKVQPYYCNNLTNSSKNNL